MLKVGLTGGIAAGKSLVAGRLAELGAVVVDADVVAREVVEPGSEGLAAVVNAFGPGVLSADGALDRAALGAVVFGSASQREKLNSIIHPLVRARAKVLAGAAPPAVVVVQDIPLLVETGQGAGFHLVLVVDAPDEVRMDRMVNGRGMTAADAAARMAAQATPTERHRAADVVIDNGRSPTETLEAVDRLWEKRLTPFNENLLSAAPAARHGGPVLSEPDDVDWPLQARRLIDRLERVDGRVLAVDHIGSTSVPGLPAKDVIDLQLTVASLQDADAIAPGLSAAGFPRFPGIWRDDPKPENPDPKDWEKRLHTNADPGRAVNLHVRVEQSPGWRYALSFRDWLRASPDMVAAYLEEKRRCAAAHANDGGMGGYAGCKEQWFTDFANPRLRRWITDTGWVPGK